MFGWEFPPYSSGGLGTACYGLTKGMSSKEIGITFVMPGSHNSENSGNLRILTTGNMKTIKVKSLIKPYLSSSEYLAGNKKRKSGIYGSTLLEEVSRFAEVAEDIAKKEEFDVIHAHDWMTFRAGINAKKVSGKPLIVHVHATDFDRTGGNPNRGVYKIEKAGMHYADKIIAVSNYTKNIITKNYGIPPEKVDVVYNAIFASDKVPEKVRQPQKTVLFLGRVTLQKGPDYFVYASKKVLELEPNTRFIIAGSGDMLPSVIEKSAELGIADKISFTGFLEGDEVNRMYAMSDLYVMPSVSEPFGIAPLEAMNRNTPVIISKQSGVSEVVKHCLKVDFWDVNSLASKIVSVLRHRELQDSLAENGFNEVKKFSWDIQAEKCMTIYKELVNNKKVYI